MELIWAVSPAIAGCGQSDAAVHFEVPIAEERPLIVIVQRTASFEDLVQTTSDGDGVTRSWGGVTLLLTDVS